MKVLLDTDIGNDIDDAICLAYLVAQPQCELVGVTTVSGRPRERAALVDAVCRAAGRSDVAIHAGTEHAIAQPTPQPDVPQSAVLGRFDHLAPGDFAPNTAVTFLRDAIEAEPGELTLLTIGPMTNSALLFTTYPETAFLLKGLVMMGGSYSASGAHTGRAEWNVYCDPLAASLVFGTRAAGHRAVGLNVTTKCVLGTKDSIERFESLGGAWGVVAAMTEVWAGHADNVTYHDPLAAAALFHPDLCEWARGRVSVELESNRDRGATAFEATADGPHEVAVDVDPDAFFAELFSPSLREPEGP